MKHRPGVVLDARYRGSIVFAWLVTMVLAGCGQSRPDDDHAQSHVSGRQLDYATNDQRVAAFVSWLNGKGVTLEYHAEGDEGYGVWRVTQPKTSDEYHVVLHIRSFPSRASEVQMREAIDVNLAFMLNAPEHLAMSYAGITGTHPEAKVPQSEDELPKVGGVPITRVVEQLFREYETASQ